MNATNSKQKDARRQGKAAGEIAEIRDFAKVLIDRILPHQGENGAFLGEDVYTFHFIEALTAISPVAFRSYIGLAVKWFAELDDPRDKNRRSVSPFRLIALMGTPHATSYQRAAVQKVLRVMVGREGNINLPICFVETPNSYDPFPTLSAVLIFLKCNDPKARKAAANGLRWVLAHMDDIKRPGTLGLLAFALLRAKNAGLAFENVTIRKIADELVSHARGKEIVSDPLQGAYVAFDLAQLAAEFPGNGLMAVARKLVSTLARASNGKAASFYGGQDRALLDLRLLAACGAVLSSGERENVVERLLGSAFTEKIEISREYRLLHAKAQEIAAENRKLREVVDGKSLLVRPLWAARRQEIDPKLVFVLMQFPDPKTRTEAHLVEMEKAYRDHLKPTLEKEFSLRVLRGDDIFDTRGIMESIWDSLLEAKIVLADLTDRNPNVFYEVGLADVLGKEVIFLTQRMEDVPFDLRNRRVIKYDTTYDGINKLKKDVAATFRNALKG
jgi:hypothetical protein